MDGGDLQRRDGFEDRQAIGELLGDHARRDRALVGPFGEELLNEVVEPTGDLGVERADRSGRAVGDLLEDREGRIPREGGLARRHLVEDGPQTEEVGAFVDIVPQRLFGSHVERRPRDEARPRDLHVLNAPREAEVGQLHAVRLLFEQDVPRLHVAMDQPFGVRGGEAGGDLHADPQNGRQRQPPLTRQPGLQRFPLDELHHQIGEIGVGGPLDLMDRDDMLMSDRGGGASLATEPLPGDFVPRQIGRQDFDGDGPMEMRIVGFEDNPHPPMADHAGDLEMAEPTEVSGVGRGGEKIEFDLSRGRHGRRVRLTTGDHRFAEILFELFGGGPIGRLRIGPIVIDPLAELDDGRLGDRHPFEASLTGGAFIQMPHDQRLLVFREPRVEEPLEFFLGGAGGDEGVGHGGLRLDVFFGQATLNLFLQPGEDAALGDIYRPGGHS